MTNLNNSEVITRLLNNHKQIVERTFTLNGEDYVFGFRPLTVQELQELETLSLEGIKVGINPKTGQPTSSKEFDAKDLIRNNNKVMNKAIHYSTGIREEAINHLPGGLTKLLYDTVQEISSLDKVKEGELHRFH